MKASDRVRFKGPEYIHAAGPFIGQLGTVTERNGYYAQRVGHEKEELITVHFDGDEKPTVLAINRIELEKPTDL